MRNIAVFLAALFCLIAQPLSADVIEGADEQVEKIANPVLEVLLECLEKNDYQKYLSQADEAHRDLLTRDKYIQANTQVKEKMGKYISREYIGFLNQSNMTVALWKARFTKIDDDVLIKLVINRKGDKYYAAGMWFQ
ncbi:MAG: hypothetical protein JW869_01510 [Candidatus Omnitrophica bacterium]|nr:hypothetical protein [Candidatus Omnitrophota bacterium]